MHSGSLCFSTSINFGTGEIVPTISGNRLAAPAETSGDA